MSTKEKQNEIMQAIEMIKKLRDQYIAANKPASFLIRAASNLSDYFAKGDFAKCDDILEETCENL